VVIPHAGSDSPRGQITVRVGLPVWFINGDDGIPVATAEGVEGAYLGVRFSARPREQRDGGTRLPGTA
jgi:hypothetical protein